MKIIAALLLVVSLGGCYIVPDSYVEGADEFITDVGPKYKAYVEQDESIPDEIKAVEYLKVDAFQYAVEEIKNESE